MKIITDHEPERRPRLELIAGEITQLIIGAFFAVYNELRYGFLESVYAGALEVEFKRRGILYIREFTLPVAYQGVEVGTYRADFFVAHRVKVEVKTQREIGEADRRQLFHYLRATDSEVGLLLNFGHEAKYQRMVHTRSHQRGSFNLRADQR